MPPRFAYWTIIAGGLPTAFRAADREDLLPTFRRIHEKHPDAVMKYFARGKLWASLEEARAAAEMRRAARARDEGRRAQTTGRGHNWRPGGEHQDPRQKFKDAKKARNLSRRRQRFERRTHGEKPDEGRHRPSQDAPRLPPKRAFGGEQFTRRTREDAASNQNATDRKASVDRGSREVRRSRPRSFSTSRPRSEKRNRNRS